MKKKPTSKKVILKYGCYKANCNERFSSWQARDRHIAEAHPPEKPRFMRSNEPHRLKNGTELKIGDEVVFTKRGIITKITLQENSDVAEVEVGVLEDSYRKETTKPC